MGPTPRDWLGAAVLTLILVVLTLVLVTTAMSAGGSEAMVRGVV